MYGDADLEGLTPVSKDKPAAHVHASLNCSAELSHEGKLTFNPGGSWHAEVSAPFDAAKFSSFELVKGEKLSLLRSVELGEIGVSFDNEASKHFFVLAKPTAKLSLPIKLSGAHVKFDAEKSALIITDPSGYVSIYNV